MKDPNIWTLDTLRRNLSDWELMAQLPSGEWVPSRPLGLASIRVRLRAAWLVLTGKADALVWPGQ